MKRFIVNRRTVFPVSASLALFLALICFSRVTIANPRIIEVPKDFPTIQGAINNATDGDEIRVSSETYKEHLTINKTNLILPGVNQDTTIIDGDGVGTVANITSGGVSLTGFTVRNGSIGIYMGNTSGNWIHYNTIVSNSVGIYVNQSTSNTLAHNNMTKNYVNFRIDGAVLQDFLQTIDDSNTVDGKPMEYWVNETDRTIPLNAGYVALVNCKNITVENLQLGFWAAWSTNITARNLDLNGDGISFKSTNDSRIENVAMRHLYGSTGIALQDSAHNVVYNNTVLSSGLGIDLWWSNFNVFCDNTFGDTLWGIGLFNSTGNMFYHNNFIDITNGDVTSTSDSVGNHWDNGAEGNYWSDKPGNDANGDGINDAPVRVDPYENDTFPLNEPWSPLREINATLWCSPSAPTQYFVTLESDHVIASRKFIPHWRDGYGLITFNITASADGFCTVTVPRVRLDIPIEVKINGTIVNEDDYNLTYVNTTWSLCFNYTQGKSMIEIKGYKLGFAIGDLDGNGVVNMGDIVTALENFGRHAP